MNKYTHILFAIVVALLVAVNIMLGLIRIAQQEHIGLQQQQLIELQKHTMFLRGQVPEKHPDWCAR